MKPRIMWRSWAAALLCFTLFSGTVWAGPTRSYWHEDVARDLSADAPQPAAYRALTLDVAQVRHYLMNAHASGIAASIELPQPNGGFADFMVVDSGTIPPELQAKYPDILSFKGSDAQGRPLRLDVSPLGFQAMVFDPAGMWLVRPQTFGADARYLSFNRAELAVPEDAWRCEAHGSDIDPAGLNLVAPTPATQTGLVHRVYRAAVAANHQYIAAVGGGTVEGGLAATIVAVNRVTQVYESEMSIQLVLVPDNDKLMYASATGDPFTSNGTGVINTSTSVISGVIGATNYDIGHVFTTGSGGVAGLGVVCKAASKGRGTTGLPNPTGDSFYIDFVAHEMGHQFGGNHPFNGTGGNCSGGNRNGSTAYEPGSGSTVMAYAGICSADDLQPHSDPYFHAISLQEITNYTSSASGSCSVNTPNDNQPPAIDMGSLNDGYTIPARTPFVLNGSAIDPNEDDSVTYSWEEWDLGAAAPLTAGDNGAAPIFRAWPPVYTGARLFPKLSTILTGTAVRGETLPTTTRALKFRLTARDQHNAHGTSSSADIAVNVVNTAGPFKVTAPVAGASWQPGTTQNVAWDVANTNTAPVSCGTVDIALSTDGGQTFPYSIGSGIANSGSASFSVPDVATTHGRLRVSCTINIFFDISHGDFTIQPAPGTYTVGGAVGGLAGSGVVLALNGSPMMVAVNGAYAFPTTLAPGATYDVTVVSQPVHPEQTCTVSGGHGTMGAANVSGVNVSCTSVPTPTYAVGGTISGLAGSGLTLQINGGMPVPFSSNGPYSFPALADGSPYHVRVVGQPSNPDQVCTVVNGQGTLDGAPATDVNVDCAGGVATYKVGGSVSGLSGSLTLALNGGEQSLVVAADGPFQFPAAIADGAHYDVTVSVQPAGQFCMVAQGSGEVDGADVTDVAVACNDDTIFEDGFDTDALSCSPQQLFQDPGFEATAPDATNPFWASTDSEGDTVLCDDSCDDGGEFVAYDGAWFAWFGGWDVANQSTLAQSVVFPAGQPRWLNLWMVNQIEADPGASLKLLVDGNLVQTFAPASDDDWAQRSVQIPAQYLDGQSHAVKFDWSASLAGTGIPGAMIDDVTLDCSAAISRPAPQGRAATAKRRHVRR